MARASEDPPSPVDAYAASATATPVGDAPTATSTQPGVTSPGYYSVGTPGTPVVQVQQPKSKPFDDWTVFAIIALFLSCIGMTIPGIVMGHVALSRIKKTGQAGRGLAIAALIVGYILTLVIIALIVVWVLFLFWTTSVGNSAVSGGDFG